MVEARIAPFINVMFVVTSEWWEQPRNHKGLDISTGANDTIYSMSDGTVVRSEYSGTATTGYGWVVIIKATDNMGFLYAHMRDRPLVTLGDSVAVGQAIGIEGTTGDSTGIHLHLEMQDLTYHDWDYSYIKSLYTDPTVFMGIPNVEGTQCIYYGTPIPPTPTHKPIKSSFPWVLYSNKLRKERMI